MLSKNLLYLAIGEEFANSSYISTEHIQARAQQVPYCLYFDYYKITILPLYYIATSLLFFTVISLTSLFLCALIVAH